MGRIMEGLATDEWWSDRNRLWLLVDGMWVNARFPMRQYRQIRRRAEDLASRYFDVESRVLGEGPAISLTKTRLPLWSHAIVSTRPFSPTSCLYVSWRITTGEMELLPNIPNKNLFVVVDAIDLAPAVCDPA